MDKIIDDDEDNDLEWVQTGTTAKGYPVYECIERPGIQRIAVPWDVWRKLYKGQGRG